MRTNNVIFSFSSACLFTASLWYVLVPAKTTTPEPLEPEDADAEGSTPNDETHKEGEESKPATNRPKITFRDMLGKKLGAVELRNILDYNNTGDLLIWEVDKKGDAVLTDLTEDAAFKSNKAYIVFPVSMPPWKMAVQYWNVYYWIGRQTPLVDVINTAKNAVLIDDAIFPIAKIKREVEDQESYAFKALFGLSEAERNSIVETTMDYDNKKNDKDDNYEKRMFRISAINPHDLQLRKVELSSRYIHEKDTCLVLDAETVYVHCGHATFSQQREGATALASILTDRTRKLKRKPVIIIYRRNEEFNNLRPEEKKNLLQFYTDLNPAPDYFIDENQPVDDSLSSEFSPEETRQILCQTHRTTGQDSKEIFHLKTTKISHSGKVEELPFDNVQLKLIDKKDCYLIDTKSNLGLYVWMGAESNVKLRKMCVGLAEIYLRKKLYSYTTLITIIDEKDFRQTTIDKTNIMIDSLELRDVISLRDPYRFLEGIGVSDEDYWSFSNKRRRIRATSPKCVLKGSPRSQEKQSMSQVERVRFSLRPAKIKSQLSIKRNSKEPVLAGALHRKLPLFI